MPPCRFVVENGCIGAVAHQRNTPPPQGAERDRDGRPGPPWSPKPFLVWERWKMPESHPRLESFSPGAPKQSRMELLDSDRESSKSATPPCLGAITAMARATPTVGRAVGRSPYTDRTTDNELNYGGWRIRSLFVDRGLHPSTRRQQR